MAVGGRKSAFSDTIEHGNDFLYDYTCSPCISDGKNREAVKFCVDCGEYLCGSCLGDHNRFAKMRSHQVVDPAKYDSRLMSPRNFHVPLITTVCEKHHGKVLDMFCGEHNEVCCAACLALDHSICKNRLYIPDIASGLNESSEYKQHEKENEKVCAQLETTKQKRFADLARHKQKKEEILASLKQCREQVIKRFGELEQRTVRLVEEKYQQSEKAATRDSENIDKTLVILKNNNVKLTNEKNDPQKFVLLKTAEKDLECARNVLQKVLASKPVSLEFYFNEKVKKCFTDVSVLGSFQENIQSVQDSFADVNVLGSFHVDIHSVQDKDEKSRCNITGLCRLEDGNLLVADVANSSIKRLGSTFKILDVCKLSSQPWSVCTFCDEVAVSMCNAKSIQFVTLKGNMQMSRSFPVKDACAGLASCGETLFVGLIKRKQIQSYDRTGYPLKSIDLTIESTHFIPWSIAITPCQTLLYVATRDNDVLSVDAEMQTCRKLNIPDQKCATCVVLTYDGNLLVSCETSNKVICFVGGKSKTVLDKAAGIESPQALCCSGQELIVASENSDAIRVHRLHD